MSTIKALKAVLTAVPVGQPCTAAAVGALFTSGHAAAKAAAAAGSTPGESRQLTEACMQQQLPGACMPVLVWLAAGLRSGLPRAAVKEAQGMACLLLLLVTQALPDHKQRLTVDQGEPSPLVRANTARMLQQLGTPEVMCQQLAEVVAALVATAVPASPVSTGSSRGSSSSSSSSSSSAKALLKQQAALGMVILHLCPFLTAAIRDMGREAMVPAFTGSGLYQALLEGALLLASANPAMYPPAAEVQLELWDVVVTGTQAGVFLAVQLASLVVGYALDAPASNHRQPWVQPLFKLQVLLLAKMQWDVRQRPDFMSSKSVPQPWPAKTLTRALTKLRSPCVAGDLLRQRAPLLLQHSRSCRRLTQTLGGRRWEVVEEGVNSVAPGRLASFLDWSYNLCQSCKGSPDRPIADAQELALLMEVVELYCLVCPSSSTNCVSGKAWELLLNHFVNGVAGVQARSASSHVPAAFAATCGEALISIAEYLTADMLLVMSSGGSSASNSSSSSSSSGGGRSSKSGAKDEGPATTSSRSSSKRPTAGGRNPDVVLKHRLAWGEDVLAVLGLVLGQSQTRHGLPQGEIGDSLISNRTAPRLRLLLETTLRTPSVLTGPLQPFFYMLPRNLPALHAAASSPAGSRALLSAATTGAKRLRVTSVALAALVEARGEVAAAAASVMAAVPGPMGEALAAQLAKEPAAFVEAAYHLGLQLAGFAVELVMRAAVLLDPVVAPAAAYLATGLPPEQDSRQWGLEAFLTKNWMRPSGEVRVFPYLKVLATSPGQARGILRRLVVALQVGKAAAEAKRAAKLAEKMGAAAGAQQMLQELGSLLLGIDEDLGTDLQQIESEQAASAAAGNAVSTNSSSVVGAPATGELPGLLQVMCDAGYLQREEVLAAGDPAQWAAAAAGPDASADPKVASTAVLMACKMAGAMAQLPLLLDQVRGAAAHQPWGQALASPTCQLNLPNLQDDCNILATWALLLAVVLGLTMPSDRAQQLQVEAADVPQDDNGRPLVTPDVASRVLGLLEYVEGPGAPGCSYPSCCNLEGRTEAELPVQACSKCRGARYCCREHQVAHWKVGHKEVCRAAQAAAKQMCDVAAGGSDQQ